jgi:hypothetical protein
MIGRASGIIRVRRKESDRRKRVSERDDGGGEGAAKTGRQKGAWIGRWSLLLRAAHRLSSRRLPILKLD